MVTVRTAGVYMLAEEHAGAIQRFASDPALGRMLGVSDPHSPTAGSDAVARLSAERLAGDGYWNVIVDEGEVRGVSAVIGAYTARPTLQVWIHPASRRRGYGELAVRLALEFAFRNLRLAHVLAPVDSTDAGQTTLLAKFGFTPDEPDSVADRPAVAPADYSLTRDEWITHRDRPALTKLHPALRAILDAELRAGNEVVETGGGWPDADSVFVRLREPFRTRPSPPPDGVVYTEPNDAHWWKADYSTTSPRHILAC